MSKINELTDTYAALWHQHHLYPASRKRAYLSQLKRLGSEDELLGVFSPAEVNTAKEKHQEALGGRFSYVTRFCDDYPALLLLTPDPPSVLYFSGVLQQTIGVAVVGSRNPSSYGTAVTTELSRDLSRLGITVVSGLARGIDSAAHAAAVRFRSDSRTIAPTIAVLGSGLGFIYPRENLRLAEEIVQSGGCLISELPIGAKPRPHYFPWRNRIISGLSEVTVIVEARERSGSLITARTALEQGREVLVVPGKIDSESFRGSNGLLRDGARPYLDITDLFACLSKSKLSGIVGSVDKRGATQLPVSVTLEESAILSVLGESEELTVDDIATHTGLSAQLIAAAVTSLSLKRIIQELPGQRFIRAVGRGERSTTDPTS